MSRLSQYFWYAQAPAAYTEREQRFHFDSLAISAEVKQLRRQYQSLRKNQDRASLAQIQCGTIKEGAEVSREAQGGTSRQKDLDG